jgi:hypothetical protein
MGIHSNPFWNTVTTLPFGGVRQAGNLQQVVRYRNLDMSNFHFRLWTWAVAALAWARLSKRAKEVSPWWGRPVWAPRLRLPLAKIRKSKAGFWTSQIPTSTYASTYRSVGHSFNSCLSQEVVLKYTQYCTSMAVDRDSARFQKAQRTTTQILGVHVWCSSWACYPSYNVTRCFPWARYCSCKIAQQGTVWQLYRGLRQMVCGDLPESGQSELSHRDCCLVGLLLYQLSS